MKYKFVLLCIASAFSFDNVFIDTKLISGIVTGYPTNIEFKIANYSADTIAVPRLISFYKEGKFYKKGVDSVLEIYRANQMCHAENAYFNEYKIIAPSQIFIDTLEIIPNTFYLDGIPYGCTPIHSGDTIQLEFINLDKSRKKKMNEHYSVLPLLSEKMVVPQFSLIELKDFFNESAYQLIDVRFECINKPFDFLYGRSAEEIKKIFNLVSEESKKMSKEEYENVLRERKNLKIKMKQYDLSGGLGVETTIEK